MGRQNFRVDGFDRSNFGMNQRRVHESRRKSSEFFPMIRRAVPAARVGSIVVGRTGVMVKVPPRWTSTFTCSPSLRWAKSMSGAFKMMLWALPTSTNRSYNVSLGCLGCVGIPPCSRLYGGPARREEKELAAGVDQRAARACPESQAPSIFPPAKHSPARIRGAGRSKECAGGPFGGGLDMA